MQALVYSRVLPSRHRFFRSASSCSELVTTKLAISYPNIICVLVDLHGVTLTRHWLIDPASIRVLLTLWRRPAQAGQTRPA
jgi:hypothetical protein